MNSKNTKKTKKAKKLANKNKKLRKINRRLKRRVAIRKRGRRRFAAMVNFRNFRRTMRIVRTNNDSMVVTGLDLVYSIPDVEINNGNQVLTVIPANPAYWLGTRISAMALGYQQYRPLSFRVHYVPIVGATQQGNVFGGTIWNNITIDENSLQQSLVTSPGSLSTQVFQPKTATVKCKSNLNVNLYNVGGELNNRSNPFYYVAIAVGNFRDNVKITPGYFWVSYTYCFKNPIGNNTAYFNLGISEINNSNFKMNTTAILCNYKRVVERNRVKVINMFTELQVDRNELGELDYTYNGDHVDINEDDKLWVFQNGPLNARGVAKEFQIDFSENDDPETSNNNWVIHQGQWVSAVMYEGNKPILYLMRALTQFTMSKNVFQGAKIVTINQLSFFSDLAILGVTETTAIQDYVILRFDMRTDYQYIIYNAEDVNRNKIPNIEKAIDNNQKLEVEMEDLIEEEDEDEEPEEQIKDKLEEKQEGKAVNPKRIKIKKNPKEDHD